MAKLETSAAFAGHRPHEHNGAIKSPIYPVSTFAFPSAEIGAELMGKLYGLPEFQNSELEGFIYSRTENPTVLAAEQRLAAWDAAEDAALFASGMAAISTSILALTSADRPLWYCPPLYGGTDHFIREVLPKMGVTVVEVPSLEDLDQTLEAQEGRLPGLIHLETPANPTMQLHRIQTAGDWARAHESDAHAIFVSIDNTYLGPVLQRPLEHGADLLLYSATKYIGGHSDLIAGAVSGTARAVDQVRGYRHFLGGILDPHAAWLLLRSMETLAIRVERQQATAQQVFAWLRCHPLVTRLLTACPEDLDEKSASFAAKQMIGPGSMASFEVAGGRSAAFKVLNSLKLFHLAVSLGSTESLAQHPASMTHAGVPEATKKQFGISEGLIRISIGIEHPEDLIADLEQALGQIQVKN